MSKANKDLPELTAEEVAFEMIDITCEEMDSLSRAFEMIAELCKELNGESPSEDKEETGSEAQVH